MRRLLPAVLAIFLCALSVSAQELNLQTILQNNAAAVDKASRKTVDTVLQELVNSGLETVPVFLERWREKEVWQRKSDGLYFYVYPVGDTYSLIDLSTEQIVSSATKKELKQLKPNSGVRSIIAAALVQFQLSDPNVNRRLDALNAIERDPEESHLAALRAAIDGEPDDALRARKSRLERLLTITFDTNSDARVKAIEGFAGDLGVDVRAVLNPVLVSKPVYAKGLSTDANVAEDLIPGKDGFTFAQAYALMVQAGQTTEQPNVAARKALLVANLADGQIGGIATHQLGNQDARDRAYLALVAQGAVPEWRPDFLVSQVVAGQPFARVYAEKDRLVTDAASAVLMSINTRVGVFSTFDLILDGLSLASIYFLAAIGLAITFGVMGVINMAHGEFIMMGAYTGYVVQQIIPDYTISILVALPAAFAVTFLAGIAMERLVIRWLYSRPLETLLATFGISIALQQLAKNIFGTQARPLTSPGWLDKAWVMNDVVSISYIRIAIFVLALGFLGLLLFILNRTRLGLEVRAVTQNSRMAASMGINPDRINMLTFGLGSGIAGIAGVAIGLYAKVTSEMGADYIVQSFMTVVVGGVGNIWGTLLGAGMIGFLQKGIEWLNPSNTLAAQTYMIIFIIIFIQFRPKGIIALKGRAAGA